MSLLVWLVHRRILMRLRALDLGLNVEVALDKPLVELKADACVRRLCQPLNLSLELVETVNAAVGASSQLAELVQGGIGHLVTVAEGLSEAKGVQVLIPSEGFIKDVGCATPTLTCFHELVDAGAGHFGACGEQENVTRINPRQLDPLQSVVCTRDEALRIEDCENIEERALNF